MLSSVKDMLTMSETDADALEARYQQSAPSHDRCVLRADPPVGFGA